jgi:hypothetical protein
MSIPDFLCPRLVGKRFDDHSIPLELLGDLAVLEPMIIEVAKWLFREDHPGRERSPRGFTDGVSLKLAAVGDGSAVAKFALSLGIGTQLFSVQEQYFERARDAIVSAIDAAAQGRPPTAHLPQKGLAYFDRLGRSLRDDEAIEFRPLGATTAVSLTRETRRRLLRAAEVTEHTDEVHIRGGIHEVNQHQLTFEIMLPDGSKVPGAISPPHYETIIEAFNGFRQGLKVQLDGVGTFSRSDRLEKIDSIEHVSILDSLDFQYQLDELRTLKNGWYDGKGQAPSSRGLDWLANAFNEYVPDTTALPYVYPVAEGGVRLEWTLGPNEASLEVDLRGQKGEWHSLNLQTDKDESQSLALDNQDDWNWLVMRLQELSGAAS